MFIQCVHFVGRYESEAVVDGWVVSMRFATRLEIQPRPRAIQLYVVVASARSIMNMHELKLYQIHRCSLSSRKECAAATSRLTLL